MTGFGRAEGKIGDRIFLIELKSLNGKQFDLRLQIPSILKPYEFQIRDFLSNELKRGSVECVISLKDSGAARPLTLNKPLLKTYYKSIHEIAEELGADLNQILSSVLRLPDVVINAQEDELSETEYQEFAKVLSCGVEAIIAHRLNEGQHLEHDMLTRIENIERQQAIVSELEPQRRVKIKENLLHALEENVGKDKYDTNRMEQELIYYIEKIDFNEEQVRLKNHCRYFRSILNEEGMSKGKKLGFILQEIGREINTTGSKAYDSEIQKSIVLMKDELEKAKEQILNIL